MLRETGQPVGHDNRITDLIAEGRGNLCADHGIIEVFESVALSDDERPTASILVVFEKGPRRAHHPELPVAVAERDRDDPVDLGPRRDVLIALPCHVVGGIADPEHGIEQELN